MICTHCGLPLDAAQEHDDSKSCPKCSKSDGREHIYYPKKSFGWTKLRVTAKNPTGIQSWCTRCRNRHGGPHDGGMRCSEF